MEIEHGQRLAKPIGEAEDRFRDEAWTYDTASLLLTLRADGNSFFRRLGGRYRRANADLNAISRADPPKKLEDRIAHIEILKKGQESRREFAKRTTRLPSVLGTMWAEQKTSWSDALALAAWARHAMSELGGARLLAFAARSPDLTVYANFANSLGEAANTTTLALDEVQKVVRASFPVVFGGRTCDVVPLTELAAKLRVWKSNLQAISGWIAARNAIIRLRAEGLDNIADGLIDGSITPTEVRPITELLIAESLWRRATSDNSELSSIEGDIRSECVLEFRDLDQQRIRAAGTKCLRAISINVQTAMRGRWG